MKRITLILIVIGIIILIAGVGLFLSFNKENSDRNTGNSLSTNLPGKSNKDWGISEIFEYKYAFSNDLIGRTSTHGHIEYNDDYKLFVFKGNQVDFNAWDTIVEDSFDHLSSAIGLAFNYSPLKQEVESTELIRNSKGEEVLKVTGEFIRDVDKEYIAFYHVTDENKVRFAIGLVENNNFDKLNQAIDLVIDNLEKI